MAELAQNLVIAISSRALFNLDDAHRIFEQEGLDAYSDYQIEKEDDTLEPAGLPDGQEVTGAQQPASRLAGHRGDTALPQQRGYRLAGF